MNDAPNIKTLARVREVVQRHRAIAHERVVREHQDALYEAICPLDDFNSKETQASLECGCEWRGEWVRMCEALEEAMG